MRREIAICATRVEICTRVRAATGLLVRVGFGGGRGAFWWISLLMFSQLLGLALTCVSYVGKMRVGSKDIQTRHIATIMAHRRITFVEYAQGPR